MRLLSEFFLGAASRAAPLPRTRVRGLSPVHAPDSRPEYSLLHARHPEGGRRPGGEENRIAAPTISGIKGSITNFSSTAFVSHRENQICVRPPSTTSSDPVMKQESSLARNRAAFAISPASPKR